MVIRYREWAGTEAKDFLVGWGLETFKETDVVRFGLRGDDSLGHAFGNKFGLLIGGSGDDTYFSEEGKASFILDGGSSGDDGILSPSIGMGGNTFTAIVDGRHFAAMNVHTGEAVYILDYKTRTNAVESVVGDQWVGSLDRFIQESKAQPKYLGEVSWERLTELRLPQPYSTIDINEMIDFYGSKARLLDAQSAGSGHGEIYRFYNMDTGTHFYSSSSVERDSVSVGLTHMQFEGASFKAAPSNDPDSKPVYRFYNTEKNVHFYTTSAEERDVVRSTLKEFSYEGVGFNAYTGASQDRAALHRFYNSETGTHFYTASELEKISIVGSLPQYHYEGVAAYVGV